MVCRRNCVRKREGQQAPKASARYEDAEVEGRGCGSMVGGAGLLLLREWYVPGVVEAGGVGVCNGVSLDA